MNSLFALACLAILAALHCRVTSGLENSACDTTIKADDWTPKSINEVNAISIQCFTESSLSDENIVKISQLEFPDEESVHKFTLCRAEKMELFCTNVGYRNDRLVKQFKLDLPEAEVKAIIDGCTENNEQGSPVDVLVYRTQQCIMNSAIGQRTKEFVNKQLRRRKPC